jgi:hypothetical protein
VHAHQVGQRTGLHFFHDPGAMDFDGALTDTQFKRNNLVWAETEPLASWFQDAVAAGSQTDSW